MNFIEVEVSDTPYSSAKEKAEFITQEIQETLEECLDVIQQSEKIMMMSLLHFCHTSKFLTEE